MSDAATLDAMVKVAAEREAKARQASIDNVKTKGHTHAILDTMERDPVSMKFTCCICCTKCGSKTHRLATSDLHQRSTCNNCAKLEQKDKKEAKKALLKKAAEMVKKGEVKLDAPKTDAIVGVTAQENPDVGPISEDEKQ